MFIPITSITTDLLLPPPPPLLPEALSIAHQNLLTLSNPAVTTPLSSRRAAAYLLILPLLLLLLLPLPRRPQHPHAHAHLPPSLAKHAPKLCVGARLDSAEIIHEPRLVALPRRVHRHVRVPVQPQVIVGRRFLVCPRAAAAAAAAVHATQVREDQAAGLEVLRRKEPVLAVGRVRRGPDGLDPDPRARNGRFRGRHDGDGAAGLGGARGRGGSAAQGGEMCRG